MVWRSPPNGLRAELVIGFPPFIGESYTSQVTLIKPYLVTATSKDMRLFKHLKTVQLTINIKSSSLAGSHRITKR